jgi:4-hydroxybenzoate polyprenyltransferase
MSAFLSLILTSRPRFWLYLAGPFLVGYAAFAGPSFSMYFRIEFVYSLLFFLFPANLILYGLNDISDQDTDAINSKKHEYETTLIARNLPVLQKGLIVSLFAVVPLFLFSSSSVSFVFVFLLLLLFGLYSLPPFRLKARPFLDSFSNVLYIIPGVYGALLAGCISFDIPFLAAVAAAWLWSAAMHLFSAIPDIAPDKAAGLQTSAVALGEPRSLIVCSGLWCAAAILAGLMLHSLLYAGIVYSIFPLACLVFRLPVSRVYRIFPFVNAGFGMALFWFAVFL